MSDYTKTYDGAAKDAANSTITGADFDTEFDNIETMSATKADKKTPAAAGDFATLDSGGNLADSGKTPPTGEVVGTSDTQTLTNKTINGDNNTISNLAHGAEVDNPSSGVHGVTGSVVGTSDTQTLTNKTLGSGTSVTGNITAGGATISPTELSYLDGATSNLQTQIDGVVGGVHCNDAGGGPYITSTAFDIDANIPRAPSSWESVGPTGSGADNIWTALDSIPSDVDWIAVRVDNKMLVVSGTTSAEYGTAVQARDSGATNSGLISRTGFITDSSTGNGIGHNVTEHHIPVTSRVFELYYNWPGAGVLGVTDTVNMYLVGYGYNP